MKAASIPPGHVAPGTVLDAIGLLPLMLPVVYPALSGGRCACAEQSAFGVSGAHAGIWFEIIVVKMAEVRPITPPTALDGFAGDIRLQPDIPLRFVATHPPTTAPIIAIRLPGRMR